MEHLVSRGAGVIDHNVEFAELLDSGRDERVGLGEVNGIGDEDRSPATFGLDQRHGFSGWVGIDVVDHYGSAIAREPQRRCATDPAGRASNDCHSIVESSHGRSLPEHACGRFRMR